MLWTAFMVLLVLCLMGLSIEIGWVLIHLLLAVGFRGCRAAPPVDIQPSVFAPLPAAAKL
jgi:hypothetical protein